MFNRYDSFSRSWIVRHIYETEKHLAALKPGNAPHEQALKELSSLRHAKDEKDRALLEKWNSYDRR